MHRFSAIILLLLVLLQHSAFTHGDELHDNSYMLLNDNTIIKGKVIGFTKGFLYYREAQRILKISPAHFKGIFNTRENAENSIILLDEPHELKDIQELKLTFSYIYKKAELILAAQDGETEATKLLNQSQSNITGPESLLDIRIYKKFLIISAIAEHYNFYSSIKELLSRVSDKQALNNLNMESRKHIEIKIKAIEYLLANPYK